MRLSIVFKIHYMKKFNIIIFTNKTLKKKVFFCLHSRVSVKYDRKSAKIILRE